MICRRLLLAAAGCCLLVLTPKLAGGQSSPSIRVMLVGDSTVASYPNPPMDRPDLTGWGQVLGEWFGPSVEVVNRAQSGASSKSFILNGNWKRAVETAPKFVLIQFGHNDQPGKGDRSTDPDGDYRDYLRRYVSESRAAGARPIFVTSVARRTFASGKIASSLGPYTSAMKAVGQETQTPVVDLHDRSMRLYARLGDEQSSDYTAAATDRTHFSRKGARAMAELVADGLRVQVPDLARLLRPSPRLTLPPVIPMVVGQESTLEFDAAVLSESVGAFRVRVAEGPGTADPTRWRYTPGSQDVGMHRLRLEATNASGADGPVVGRGETWLHIVPARAGEAHSARLLLIGDSLTHGSIYPNELARLLSRPGNPPWKMLGTHQPAGAAPEVRHEGYGGWTWQRFVERYEPGAPDSGATRNSPFLFPSETGGKPKLDLKRYFAERCGGETPDLVTVMLGINDCFGLNPDRLPELDQGIHRTFQHAESLIAAIRSAAPGARIGICLTPPPNRRDGAFEANYKGRYPRWGWRRIQHRLVELQLDQFGGREHEGIYLVPTELDLDPMAGYPESNGVHPNATGYRQIGRSIYAWIKQQLQTPPTP